MPRSTKEWQGKNDDTPIPPRVKLRIAERANYTCALCTRGAKPGEADHKVALILGGENRESNLQWLCIGCHKAKTKADVRYKAVAAKAQKRMAGINKPRRGYWSLSRKMNGDICRWNPATRKYDILVYSKSGTRDE